MHQSNTHLGGRHSTEVVFTLRTQPAQVRVTAPEFFQKKNSDVAVLIDSALLREWAVQKKLNKVDQTHPALVKSGVGVNSPPARLYGIDPDHVTVTVLNTPYPF